MFRLLQVLQNNLRIYYNIKRCLTVGSTLSQMISYMVAMHSATLLNVLVEEVTFHTYIYL